MDADAPYFDKTPYTLPCCESIRTLHYHDKYEIGVCVEGEGLFLCEGVFSSVSRGDVIFIPPGKRHYSRSLDPNAPCLCRFVHPEVKGVEELLLSVLKSKEQVSALLTFSERRIPSVLHPTDYPVPTATLCALADACRDGVRHLTPISELRLALFFMEAQNALCQDPVPEISASTDEVIVAVAEHLAVHYDRGDSVDELTRLCHLSQSQLRRRFLTLYGISPIAYRNRLRCRIASELLCHTELSVAQIAERIGYTDVSDFYRHFKKNYGVSPSLYRAKGKLENAFSVSETSDRTL